MATDTAPERMPNAAETDTTCSAALMSAARCQRFGSGRGWPPGEDCVGLQLVIVLDNRLGLHQIGHAHLLGVQAHSPAPILERSHYRRSSSRWRWHLAPVILGHMTLGKIRVTEEECHRQRCADDVSSLRSMGQCLARSQTSGPPSAPHR